MSFTSRSSLMIRLRRELPPSPPHPATLQTLAGQQSPYAYLERCRARVGDRFTLYPLFMPPMVFLSSPSDIRELVAADASKLHPGAGAAIIAPLIGDRSFMLLEEDEHRSGRKTITPAFHQRMVKFQSGLLNATVTEEISKWPRDTEIALHPLIRRLALKIILDVIFSDKGSALGLLHAQLLDALNVTTSFILQEPNLRYLPGWRGTWRQFLRKRDQLDKTLHALVRSRRHGSAGERGDLLDLLLSAENENGSPLTEQQIRDNLMSMILAGHETTTGELTWAFQLLAHNPTVQQRLTEEIDTDDGQDQYLTATVQETMRHKPVFLFIIPRKVVHPVEIGDWTYRPPAHLAGCTYLMHHDPALYEDPQRFWPERFLAKAPPTRTWLPWGGGRKHCLGRHFALLEIKAILRTVLKTDTVIPTSGKIELPRWRSAILVPRHGGRVILKRRNAPTR